MKTETENQL